MGETLEMTPGVRVSHAELGEGVVLEASRDGYVRAFFGAGERRVPLAALRPALSRADRILANVAGTPERLRTTPAVRNSLLDALLVDVAAAITADRTLGGTVEWAQPGSASFEDVEFEGAAAARTAAIPITLWFTVAGSPLA